MPDSPLRELSERAAGPRRQVFVAGIVALTEPGPAASGLVVADDDGRALAHRAQYLGEQTRTEATVRALTAALRLAATGGLEAPTFRLEDGSLVEALRAGGPLPPLPAAVAQALRDALAEVPGAQFRTVSPSTNPARSVAMAPLVDWLPARTRRAEDLQVRALGDRVYEVESASMPGHLYRVVIPAGEDLEPAGRPTCDCPDFEYRGIPCKHLLAVAREAGLLDRLFRGEAPSR